MIVGFMRLSVSPSHYLSFLDPQILISRRLSERRSIYYRSSQKKRDKVCIYIIQYRPRVKKPPCMDFRCTHSSLFCRFSSSVSFKYPHSVCFIRHKKSACTFLKQHETNGKNCCYFSLVRSFQLCVIQIVFPIIHSEIIFLRSPLSGRKYFTTNDRPILAQTESWRCSSYRFATWN